MSDETALDKKIDSLRINGKPNPFAKRGIAANIQEATKVIEKLDPNTRLNRLGLVCDDSGSMSGEAINNAHSAVRNFTANCKPQDTSITIYPLNAESKPLTCDFDILNLYWSSIGATGGTPLYTILKRLIETEKITRAIVFSDGGPTDGRLYTNTGDSEVNAVYDEEVGTYDMPRQVVKLYNNPERKIPIDTIFIGTKDSTGYKELELLAKLTGGIFIHFTDSSSLTTNLKYLTPGLRGLLANPEIKEKIQRGEKV
jgi:hypothetical protein